MSKLKLLELFGGIGACSRALDHLGIEYELVDYVEIDKYACKSFNAIHGTNFEPQDVKQWDKKVEVDLIMHGSPCQDFSIAGRGQGGNEGSGTRSSLMYETVRIVSSLKPKYVLWENVKNLLSEKHRYNFDMYLDKMEDLGYRNYYQVLNAKDYGVPQNRERVFTVSIRKDIQEEYKIPEPIPLELRLKDILEDQVEEKFFLSDEMVNFFVENNKEQERRGNGFRFKVADENGLAKAVLTGGGTRPEDNFVYDTSQGVVTEKLRIRRLTPKECWRLMGFDDEAFEKARQVNSDTQLYKQAGNSIVVDVLEAILTNLLINPHKLEKEQMSMFDFIER